MMRRLRALARRRDGVAALEFALIAPGLLLSGLGTLEYGRLSWTREALQAAAIMGARCMGVIASDCGTAGVYSSSASSTYIINRAGTWRVTLTTSAITQNRGASCGGTAGFSQVTINYTFQTVLPLVITSLANGIPLTVSACYPNTR